MPVCPSCNREIAVGAHFCPECGAALPPVSQTLLGCALVVVILAYGFLTATHGRSIFRDPLSDPVPGGPRALP
jgi:hypothetical protein